MAEVAFNIAEQVITKLGSVAFQEIELISGAKDDLKKLENSLTTIKAVLIDAEEKQEKSLAVKSWLRRLQDIVYEADELVDEVATNDLQRMVQAQSQGKVVTQVCNIIIQSVLRFSKFIFIKLHSSLIYIFLMLIVILVDRLLN
ncbi:hypothetical protein P3X46_033943 [Hevea brasiliensis]|uniref:Disease resistance N-terminal domain-containing protein n=1 Tax=Hevea brasiliensis TaxID=3981 RepID=A0ABQ9K989_HEVBR|nr:hypothetical protein P3X46_033943 [Hevea brasiliensis]